MFFISSQKLSKTGSNSPDCHNDSTNKNYPGHPVGLGGSCNVIHHLLILDLPNPLFNSELPKAKALGLPASLRLA